MRLLLKNTQTLIGSIISTIVSTIYRRKGESQETRMKNYQCRMINYFLALVLALFIVHCSFIIPTHAITDPTTATNNRFGIHIITPTADEVNAAYDLVNSTGGDWGYITVVIEDKDMKLDKWQQFFNLLRQKHLIPIVRLATHPEGNSWARPTENLAQDWANFLDQLNWPIKNRYITIYNEPNHGAEWGGEVDPAGYAKVLDQTITALKNKNPDFFVMNAGLDVSTPEQPPRYKDALQYMQTMDATVPGIFEKLDGWVSHSYPNPGFVGTPDDSGRGTVRTWYWELQILRDLGVKKNLPVFITETGWKHAQGLNYNPSLPSTQQVADYYKISFQEAWDNNRIVAVTPFILNYQNPPFDHFSFKKVTGEKQEANILGVQFPEEKTDFHPHYLAIKDLPKISGKPLQENKFQLTKGEVYSSIVAGESYKIYLTFKNTGQSIWNDNNPVMLKAIRGGKELGIIDAVLPKDTRVEPNQEYTFAVEFKAPLTGKHQIALNLFNGDSQFSNNPIEFETEVKSPVIIEVKTSLKWKENFAGQYLLSVIGPITENLNLTLSKDGLSPKLEARELLPDYAYEFTLEKPYYESKTINQTLHSGVNVLDFGVLEPNILSVIFNPQELWKILPWSNN